jgi:hypothetical protein
MTQYTRHLLALSLAASSAFIFTPCYAQTPEQLTNDTPDNTIHNSSLSTPASNFSKSDETANSKPAVISAENKPETTTAAVPTTKSNQRIPIFSRIFPVPSMQQ